MYISVHRAGKYLSKSLAVVFSGHETTHAHAAAVPQNQLPLIDYKHLHKPDMILALSEDTQKIFSSAFRIPENRIVITGYPRNDIILKNKESTNQSDKKKFIYMPTFRGKIGADFDLFLDYGFDIDKPKPEPP